MAATKKARRAALVATAGWLNADYRDESNGRDLEVGYLYGMADLIVAETMGDGESFSAARGEVATVIDKLAAKDKYPLLPANGYVESES